MNKIKLNNLELEVESYNRTTYFTNGTMSSNASCSVRVNDMTALNAVALEPITAIQIYADNTLIYDLQDINAHIDNISEYLNGDRVNISLNMSFQLGEQNEDNSETV